MQPGSTAAVKKQLKSEKRKQIATVNRLCKALAAVNLTMSSGLSVPSEKLRQIDDLAKMVVFVFLNDSEQSEFLVLSDHKCYITFGNCLLSVNAANTFALRVCIVTSEVEVNFHPLVLPVSKLQRAPQAGRKPFNSQCGCCSSQI